MSKEKISITLNPTQVRAISDRVGDEYDNRSEAVRALIDRGVAYEDLQEEYEDLEARHDDVQRQLAAVNSRQEDVSELVEYVQEERSLAQEQRQRRDAPVWRRARWWILGRDE